MIWLSLFRQIRYWDRPSQIALALAILSLVSTLILLVTLPATVQGPLLGTLIVLLIVTQLIFMWGNRFMVKPFTQAQQAFIAGDFEDVIQTLNEVIRQAQDQDRPVDADALVLMGNAYRNLGQLDDSFQCFEQALSLKPASSFALYGVGKTLLAQGDYQQALQYFADAIQHGASVMTYVDVAHTAYRLDQVDGVRTALNHLADTPLEPYRQVLIALIKHKMFNEPTALETDVIEMGLVFWQAEAERFATTPYGQAVAQDIRLMAQMQ